MQTQYPAQVDLAEGFADPDYKSNSCPDGYDTAVGYLTQYLPHLWDLMDQMAEGLMGDDLRLKRQARAEGVSTKHIASPPWLVRQGIFEVRAYPIPFLREYFGE
jgi:hypothetical protein